MVDLRTDRVVVVSHLVGPSLQVLCLSRDEATDPSIMFGELVKLITELDGLLPLLNFDFSRERLEFVDVFGAQILFNSEELHIEVLLVGLFEEGHQELRGLQYVGLKADAQEPLIVDLSLHDLSAGEPLLLFSGQRRDDNLRVRSEQILSQDVEVGIESFDAPFHREGVDRHDKALFTDILTNA